MKTDIENMSREKIALSPMVDHAKSLKTFLWNHEFNHACNSNAKESGIYDMPCKFSMSKTMLCSTV
jgi:hypothetical protein